MLCELCSNLDFVGLLNSTTTGVEVLPHCESYDRLFNSATQGCKLCQLLHNQLLEQHGIDHGLSSQEADARERQCDQEADSEFGLVPIDQAFSSVDSPVTTGLRGLYYERESFKRWKTAAPAPCSIELAILPFAFDHPALVSRPVSSQASVDRCKQWIDHCSARHSQCSTTENRPLPTRLIDVGSEDQDPKLIVTSKKARGQYVALSHCWGTSKPPATTQESYDKFLKAIPLDILPATFRDAINVVRELGYQYLWIDCFCIIQGSEQDFQIECSRMHATFENAVVTICAPAADNASAGLLHLRETWSADLVVEVPCCDNNQQLGSVLMRKLRESIYIQEDKDWEDALAKRAWIIQERLLSPRVVYFGKKITYFECNTSDCYETLRYPTFPNGDPESGDFFGGRDLIKYAFSTLQDADPIETWFRLLGAYTSCNLTKDRDKLPALSGLASRIKQRTNDQYVAGMWYSQLLRQLCWGRIVRCTTRKSRYPNDRSTPSWSWISCDYELEFPTAIIRSSFHTTRSHVEFVEISTEPLGLDAFGEVKHGGFLKITGKLREVCIRGNPHKKEGLRNLRPFCICPAMNTESIVASYSPDEPIRHPDPDEILYDDSLRCLLLGTISPGDLQSGVDWWVGLVLRPLEESPSYFRRVGLAHTTNSFPDENWMKLAEGLEWILGGALETIFIL